MPYFPDQKLLFIHIPKNAGKSVEMALGLDKTLSDLYRLGRRGIANRAAVLLQRLTAPSQARRRLHGVLDVTLTAQHLTFQEIRLLNLAPAEGVRSFAVIRDPFERAVSTFLHVGNRDGGGGPEAFEDFCLRWFDLPHPDHNLMALSRRQIDFVRDCDGRIGVDRLLPQSRLGTALAEMFAEWGLPARSLGHEGNQTRGRNVDHWMTGRARAMIAERFAEDIELHAAVESGRLG